MIGVVHLSASLAHGTDELGHLQRPHLLHRVRERERELVAPQLEELQLAARVAAELVPRFRRVLVIAGFPLGCARYYLVFS